MCKSANILQNKNKIKAIPKKKKLLSNIVYCQGLLSFLLGFASL